MDKDIETILRDMSDGVIMVDGKGTIKYLNPSASVILQDETESPERRYAELMADDEENNEFHQFVLDAIYDKDKTHSGVVGYTRGGVTKKLKVTSSFVFSEDKEQRLGVSVVMSDITELARLMEIRRESSIIFTVIMSVLTMFLFLWRVLDGAIPDLSPATFTLMIEGFGLIGMVIILKATSLRLGAELRLENPWRQMRPFVIISAAGVLALVLLKAALLRLGVPLFPEDIPFWNWGHWGLRMALYPARSLVQEVLARCMMQNSLRYVFGGKYQSALSILVSSLIFGSMHIMYGINYMVAASLLLCLLGVLYEKTRNLWGVTLVHYTVGVCFVLLGFSE
ncbi:MAG: CPBP family glutamic-type intramembrane protease [Oscillospiraceae bacterium]|nr:CPBP family glutamic-type intramembrane protease [Oscillospiraceae bacterium]